ncbi:hypothetical protein Sliba_42850 [Streptomyces nigrescens]|uniref:Uncharacterized protein n=1 Tax=Streptomyces nigrescens TaxID=1920 RepID=A0A640TLL8_STRNI|nr:hypothetical protein Sliba_42850 [Streptomyces libani subsp. libani]GGV99120.1 hypothetical protein GCM10010500_48970 [Streptomyces libani subsp. libani]
MGAEVGVGAVSGPVGALSWWDTSGSSFSCGVRVAVGWRRFAYGVWVVGSEGTPGNPSSARATRVPEVGSPVVRSGSCGRLTGHPLRPPYVGGSPAVPITVTNPCATPWQGPGRAARSWARPGSGP